MPTTKTAKKKIAKPTNAKAASNSIRFKISVRQNNSADAYEAVAEISGFKPTKVTRQDGTTVFTTRSSITKVCRDRAAALRLTPVFDFGTLSTTAKTKLVARFSGKVQQASGVCPVTGASS